METRKTGKWRPIVRRICIRLGISIAVGCIVTIIAVIASWREHGNLWLWNEGQANTHHILPQLQYALDVYREAHGTDPESLNSLPSEGMSFRDDETGTLLDGWHRPFHYAMVDGKGVATSYGLDGQPGGVGFDSDLSTGDVVPVTEYDFTSDHIAKIDDRIYKVEPDAPRPTLRQFVFDADRSSPLATCGLAGIFAAITCLAMLREVEPTGKGIVPVIIAILFTSVFAVIFAVIESTAALSGH